jgi:DNA-binding CsgD family transcriptional regulator
MPAEPQLTEGLKPLSPREHELLGLMAEGAPDREIAAQLFLSLSAVTTYARRIFAKLGARNRAHAVHIGHQHGLFDA